MVNPIASGVAAVPFGTLSADFERRATLPEPAVKVTKASDTPYSGDATSAQRDVEPLPEGMDPLGKAIEMLNSNMTAWSTGMRFDIDPEARSEEHTSELQSLMSISYAVFCLKKKKFPLLNHHLQYTCQSH